MSLAPANDEAPAPAPQMEQLVAAAVRPREEDDENEDQEEGSSNDNDNEEETENGSSSRRPRKKRKRIKQNYSHGPAIKVPFHERLFEMLEFRAANGHCNVPYKHPLRPWIMFLQQQYKHQKELEEHQKSGAIGPPPQPPEHFNNPGDHILTPARKTVLTSIDFVWDFQFATLERKWMETFEEVKAYVAANDGKFPPMHGATYRLGQWCSNHRSRKRDMDRVAAGTLDPKEKFVSHIPPHRIELLNSIGFEWGQGEGGRGTTGKTWTIEDYRAPAGCKTWEQHFQQLVEYKKEHGNCSVPCVYKPDKTFGRWVMKQKHQQVLLRQGLKSKLKPDQARRLEELGIVWSREPSVKKKRKNKKDAPPTIQDQNNNSASNADENSNVAKDTTSATTTV
jgi:hypothetical protein